MELVTTGSSLWIQFGFMVLTVICLLLIHWSTGHRSIAVHFSRPEQIQLRRWLVYYPAVWALIVSAVAATGFFFNFTLPPRFMVVLLVPVIYALVLFRRPLLRSFFEKLPQAWILWLQAFRIPVELLLWGLFLYHEIPVQMTFEGQNWDILSGLFGLLLGFWRKAPKTVLQIYNLLGMALLINIVSVALLSTPLPFRAFMNEPANTIVTLFPVILLPAFLVPLAYYLHIASWMKLKERG